MRIETQKLHAIDALRGLAALSVAWYHLTLSPTLEIPEWLRRSGAYGWLGVEVFFVISGFVIPYALWRGHYQFPRDLGRFFAKRLIRLDPPYLASLALAVALMLVAARTPAFTGPQLHLTAGQLLAHLGYLNALIGYEWLNLVYWTLGIEFQFYVLAAIVFPLLMEARTATIVILSFAVAAVLDVTAQRFISHYGPLFGLGMVAFCLHAGVYRPIVGTILTAVVGLIALASIGPTMTIAGVLTALCLRFFPMVNVRPLAAFGAISYSLYLLHVPIGARFVNLGARFAHGAIPSTIVLALGMLLSLIAAVIFYRCVERPAQRWASSISYRPHVLSGAASRRSLWSTLISSEASLKSQPSENAI